MFSHLTGSSSVVRRTLTHLYSECKVRVEADTGSSSGCRIIRSARYLSGVYGYLLQYNLCYVSIVISFYQQLVNLK